ncbi:MAG: response regulator [Spirochaetales bacterium]|nr:response regulator [Spirochaetales bacterium]
MEEKTKILIVDDEPINLDFFNVMLSKLGFEVEKAEDGEEALEKVVTTKPDLIILDNIMPKMSGWKVTRLLKTDERYADYKDIPVVMFSAMDDVKDKIEGFELGIEDYITKPFNFSEVLARIRAVLRNKELSRQLLRRERKIALVESLNESLLYFTEHLKRPVIDLQAMAKSLDVADRKQIDQFRKMVEEEAGEVLASLQGLEEEIQELNDSKKNIDEDGTTILKDLEEKFQKHFSSIQRQGAAGGTQ